MNSAATRLAVFVLAVLASCSEFARGQSASITISHVQPTAGALVGDALNVVVIITSTFEIAKVVAEVEGRQVNLVRSSFRWTGVISLSGLASGSKTLTTSATD